MKINSPDWYPCYLNPSFDEILELARSHWDTCRIMCRQPHGTVVEETPGDFVIASGQGWTHGAQMDCYAHHLGGLTIEDICKRCGTDNSRGERRCSKCYRNRYRYRNVPSLTAYILHHRNGIALFNLEDSSGSQYARFDEWERYFYTAHVEMLKDLVRESGLSL
jgi:hypothetical protein